MIQENTSLKIKSLLADQLGLEIEDINSDDSLNSDLHMRPSDLSDLTQTLEANDMDTSKLDFTQVETVEELIDAITGGI